MKAEDLIKAKGINYAQDIVYNAPSNALEWNEGFAFKCGQGADKITKADKEKYFVSIPDLKRLVESHELIKNHGGLHSAKHTLKILESSLQIGLYHGIDGVNAEIEIPKLKQAIADVEACQEEY